MDCTTENARRYHAAIRAMAHTRARDAADCDADWDGHDALQPVAVELAEAIGRVAPGVGVDAVLEAVEYDVKVLTQHLSWPFGLTTPMPLAEVIARADRWIVDRAAGLVSGTEDR